jgi:hypothetical protein
MVLRGIFGAKRDEVTGEWRKIHNEELNDLYCSPNIHEVGCGGLNWIELGQDRGTWQALVNVLMNLLFL